MKLGTLKKFIRQLHDTYGTGTVWSWLECRNVVDSGSVRKRHIDALCNAAMHIWSVYFFVCLFVTYMRVFYFINIEKQSLSVTRQGRLEMVRGNALRNEYYLAIIFQICNNVICNPAMYTRCARICNAAKLVRNSTRQRTYVLYLCTEQNQSTSVMRQGVLGMLCGNFVHSCNAAKYSEIMSRGNSTPSLYIYLFSPLI